jgi:hypothetical protein
MNHEETHMNSKSLQYNSIENSKLEKLVSTQESFITAIKRKISDLLTRSEIEKAQSRYMMKHAAQAQSNLDIVRTLPLEEKLRLGMYHYMG